MRWLAVIAVLSFAAPAGAAEGSLCLALADLRLEAQSSGSPQRISVFKDEPMVFACGRKKEVPAQDAFCSAAFDAVGLEFTHIFPWKVYDCLKIQGANPNVTLVDQYTGIQKRKKVTHLWAAWGDGTRVDINFEPTGNFADDAEYRDYFGVYRLVIWRP